MRLTLRLGGDGGRLLPVGCGQPRSSLTTGQEATLSVEDDDFVELALSEDEDELEDDDEVVEDDFSEEDLSEEDFSEDDDAAAVDDLPSERLSVR